MQKENTNSVVVDSSCKKCKTINSRYSLVVTHPTTNLPAHGLSTAERTGSPAFHVLWSIAEETVKKAIICKQFQMTSIELLPHSQRMPMTAADSSIQRTTYG